MISAQGTSGAAASFSAFDAVTDLITGNSTRGPYFLTWRKIEQDSESVIVNSSRMRRGDDYVIDYETGVLSFSRLVAVGAPVRISYRQKSGVSEKNDGKVALPIRLDLSQSERGGLSVIGLYKQNPQGARSNSDSPGIGVFGLSGTRKLGKFGETSTMFLTGPAGSGGEGRFWDRSALVYGAAGAAGKMSFKASFQRAGEQFAGASDYSLRKGMEVQDLSVAFNPSTRLAATSSIRRTEDLGGADEGTKTTATEHSMVYTPSQSSRIMAAHVTQNLKKPDGTETASVVDRVRLEQRFGKAAATASMEQKTVQSSGVSDTISTQKLAVTAAPSSAINVKASVARESYLSKGDDTAASVQVVAKPTDKVGVQVEVSAHESDFATDERIAKVRVEARPAGFLKVSAGVGERLYGNVRDVSGETRVEFLPYKRATIAAGYLYTGSGLDKTAVTELTAKSKPINFLELSGRYKDRENSLYAVPDTMGVELALTPLKRFSVYGQYARNPENKQGVALLQDMRSVGLKTRIGSFGFTGGLSVNQELALGIETTTRELGMSLRVFGRGELTTGYKEMLTMAGLPCGTKQYTLGYIHNVGSDFNLTLAGTMTQYEADRSIAGLASDRANIEAQAKLGMRF